MNRLSKILVGIIILLIIALGFFIYKFIYFKNGYLESANAAYNHAKILEDHGVQVIVNSDNKTEVHIKDINTVIIDKTN